MSTPIDTLRHATSVLFDPDAYPITRLEAANSMFALFSELSGIDDGSLDPSDTGKTVLPSGVAVSPIAAARCVLDVMRTTQFLRGLDAAIRKGCRRFPGRRLHLLYAGCGPFATLALPICTRFTPDEIGFTLIDIHQRSLDSARRIAERLDLTDYIRATIRADAATYRHPDGDPVHIVVAEVLQCALDTEPQLAVTANLAPQLVPGGLFIPESIRIDLARADLRVRFDTPHDPSVDVSATWQRNTLSRVLDLNAVSASQLMAQTEPDPSTGTLALPPVYVRIPSSAPHSEDALVLLTTIVVFDAIKIDRNESGLTMMKVVAVDAPAEGDVLEVRYLLGSAPGFRCRLCRVDTAR